MSESIDDIGIRAIEQVFRLLQIDAEWSTRTGRGFSWIGLTLEQTVEAAPVKREGEFLLAKLTAHTVVVEHVAADEATVIALLNSANRHAFGSAYSFKASTRSITVSIVTWLHEETFEWRVQQFALYVTAQLAVAESEAAYLASSLGGTVAAREHARSGRREQRDDMLMFFETRTPLAVPSRFGDRDELESLAYVAKSTPGLATLGAGEHGVTFDVSYGNSTCLLEAHVTEPHRRAGVGLTVRLRLPTLLTSDEACAYANTLNVAEARGAAETTHVGAWCCDEWTPGSGIVDLAYQVFIPNALYRVGVTQDTVASMVKRTRWTDWGMHGQPSTANAWEAMYDRLRLFFGSDK